MKLDVGLYLSMVSHAIRERPWECVGILYGIPGKPICEMFELTNVAAERAQTYRVSPAEQLRVEQWIEQEAYVPLAIYHSHPTSDAVPSGFDHASAWNDIVTIIIGLRGFPGTVTMRAFRLHGRPNGEGQEIDLEVV